MAAKGPAKGDRAETLDNQLLSSLSYLGQIISYLCPRSRKIFHFVMLINLRDHSQKSCKSTMKSDVL